MKKTTFYLWHLVVILMMSWVGVSQANADELTVFDGTDTNSRTPYDINWGDEFQKHEFIIPAESLVDMKGSVIKNMTFYSTTQKSTPGVEVKIFFKEVDQTTFTGFIGEEGATTVYSGELALADNQWNIPLSTEYAYEGGNLLVGVYTTKVGIYTYFDFYGKQQEGGAITAIYGKNQSDINNVTVQYNMDFIPKTTFTYEVGTGPAEPEGTVLDNILALKNFEFTDPMADSEDVVLKLDNAKVTYVNAESDFVVIEDASAGHAVEASGFSTILSEGQTLNGNLAMTISYGWMGNEISLKNGLEGVTVTDGEVNPFVVTEENAMAFASDYDWRLAQVADVTVNIVDGAMYASVSQLGDMKLPINDRFNCITAIAEDGMVGTLTGFIFSAYGMTFCTPISFVENSKLPEFENLLALKNFEFGETSDDVTATLKLNNAKVTFVSKDYDAVIMEDESSGYIFENSGLGDLLNEGQVLNGTFEIVISKGWFGSISVKVNDGIDNVSVETTEINPIVVTEENVSTYMNDYDWRFAQIDNVVINVGEDEYGKYFILGSDLLGNESIWLNDRFGFFDESIEDGTQGTITGYLYIAYSSLWFQPISFTPEFTSINNVENNSMNNGAIYNINGQRLSAPVKGINIINGKKIVVK